MAVWVMGSSPHCSALTAMEPKAWVWMTQATSGRAPWMALWMT